MSKFDLTFFKVYIYAKGWPGINLRASHESCAHPSVYVHQSNTLPVPTVLSENITNKRSLIGVEIVKYAFWITLRPLRGKTRLSYIY